MGFKDVLGHDVHIDRLQAAIVGDRVHHAYLISGMPGVGRRTLANVFSRALNCERQDGDACDECPSCRKALAGVHPDIRVIAGDPSVTVIKVEVVRTEIIRFVGIKRSEGRYRVLIIPNVERMQSSAANAFLKTLEEPPPGTVFLLTTDNVSTLLPTIRSRCQKMQLSPLSEDLVASYLVRQNGMDPERAGAVARISGGSLGKALSLKEDDLQSRLTFLDTIMRSLTQPDNVVDLVERVAKGKLSRQLLATQLDVFDTFLRDAAALATAPTARLMNPDLRETLETFLQYTTFEDIVRLNALTKELRTAMKLNVALGVILERLFIGVHQLGKASHAH